MAQNVLPFSRRKSFASRMFGSNSSMLPSPFMGDSSMNPFTGRSMGRGMSQGVFGRSSFTPDMFGLRRYRMDNRDMWAGLGLFAVGAVIGAGIGLLFAPKSGHELRSDISRMSGNARGMLPGANREPEHRMHSEYGSKSHSHPRR